MAKLNETETRVELIDKQLEAVGWKTGGDVRVYREYRISEGQILSDGMRKRGLVADYVLSYKGAKLAVVEAKSIQKNVREGVAQAKLHAEKLRLRHSLAANGKEIYQVCHKPHKEGKVDRFPSPQELWDKNFSKEKDSFARFHSAPFEYVGGRHQPRYYQELAVERVIKAISQRKDRILLTLATGTGKTFIAFQIVWKLFQSSWNLQFDGKRRPRILFLADRNILANQALNDFGAFPSDALIRIRPNEITKRKEVPKNGSIFFSIFQTFMSSNEGEYNFGQYEKDFFDMVIIDECHRGGANDESTYREILKHFNTAVHLGLTATPKRKDNVDTYKYFGEPVFSYSLKEGIEDGFLTPFRLKRIKHILEKYKYSSDDDVLAGKVDQGRTYVEKDFNNNIIIEERERMRAQEMLVNINQNEKTLVFCANQSHAALIRDIINQEADNKSVDYCVRVTANDGEIGENYLRQFQDNEKSIPTILTTSQKLSTGVDARDVRNIVLLRPVNSMIEFKQIVGRGTRLYEGKSYFTILDFVNAYEHFNDPEWDGMPEEESGASRGGGGGGGGDPIEITEIRLADGKIRKIKPEISTLFYLAGKPVNVEEFIRHLFDIQFPKLFSSEAKLRKLWSNPNTRQELLTKLEEKGCCKEDLQRLQKLIGAEDSDLFDVLVYIAYTKKPIARAERVQKGKRKILTLLNKEEREFIEYALANYIKEGVDELDSSRLSKILEGKYGSLDSAKQQLGSIPKIKDVFTGFQKDLYRAA